MTPSTDTISDNKKAILGIELRKNIYDIKRPNGVPAKIAIILTKRTILVKLYNLASFFCK